MDVADLPAFLDETKRKLLDLATDFNAMEPVPELFAETIQGLEAICDDLDALVDILQEFTEATEEFWASRDEAPDDPAAAERRGARLEERLDGPAARLRELRHNRELRLKVA